MNLALGDRYIPSSSRRTRRNDDDDEQYNHVKHTRRYFHSSTRTEILPLLTVIVVGGMGFIAYKKLSGDKSIFPSEAQKAQEAYHAQNGKFHTPISKEPWWKEHARKLENQKKNGDANNTTKHI
jgi:hypothetical protein